MNIDFRPMPGKVVVRVEEDNKTVSGIVTIEERGPSMMGRVVAGKWKGKRVLFKAYEPEEVEWKGKTYLIMEEDNILALAS